MLEPKPSQCPPVSPPSRLFRPPAALLGAEESGPAEEQARTGFHLTRDLPKKSSKHLKPQPPDGESTILGHRNPNDPGLPNLKDQRDQGYL